MNDEYHKALERLKRELNLLTKDLQRPPARMTCKQRVESCLALVSILERQSEPPRIKE